MSWTKVIAADTLPTDSRQVVKVGNYNLLLLNHQGQLYAVSNTCPHMKISMKKGKITDDGAIVCPMHRSSFDLKTGAVKEWTPWPPLVGKALGMISQEKALPVFPIKAEEGSIWVDLAEV
ncbi:Rieske (2Fe-2S) protein [Crocosphaera sp. UHCC 0190]|uniref:Rieske (2Fe-2S) protein n=1 Tax=Crocosphaera sp. UHCC 0190 TaxID=3110246 RepID=UPI002B1F5CE6|nr:Rieske (2Fe-2S) protein [Crocosphaera sp. UHCC 0190]MEA5509815.1 Rieske (2Fe-2S) protein [Crocosphaera sp. UHCC 0190]